MTEYEMIEQIKDIIESRKMQRMIMKLQGVLCDTCNPDIQALERNIRFIPKRKRKSTRI